LGFKKIEEGNILEKIAEKNPEAPTASGILP
jgi:hypothetical protein